MKHVQSGWSQRGVASWYGRKFDGKPTASGERFDMYAMTAAHRTLPLGTLVKVTNLDNGRSAILKINDRGPFVSGRILDCSYGAAKKLGFAGAGLAHVRIQVVKRGRERPTAMPPPGDLIATGGRTDTQVLDGSFCVQVGAFHVKSNAARLAGKLQRDFGDAYVIRFRDFYRVRVGHLSTQEAADDLQNRLRSAGYGSGFVTRND
jgi:rare lipoprotein A